MYAQAAHGILSGSPGNARANPNQASLRDRMGRSRRFIARARLDHRLLLLGLGKSARWVFTPCSEPELSRVSRQREFTDEETPAHLTPPDAMISVPEGLQASAANAVPG